MTELIYFDCNPFMRWAEQRAAGASDRATFIANAVDGILSDASRERYVSEVTIAEFHSNVITHRRSPNEQYGDEWLADVTGRFFRLIADGTMQVLDPPPRLVERAMALVSMVSAEHRLGLRAWDGVHLTYAYELARQTDSTVALCSGDHIFNKVLNAYPTINERVTLLDPDAARVR